MINGPIGQESHTKVTNEYKNKSVAPSVMQYRRVCLIMRADVEYLKHGKTHTHPSK